MKTLNSNQLKAIYALLGEHGLRDEKESIIQAFTGGRSTHVSDMTSAEAAALIGHLKSLDNTEAGATRMRNKILSMAHEMNWCLTPGPSPQERGVKRRIDMGRVNNWCISRSYLKKKLDDYTYSELPKLVSQFEEVYKSHLKTV